MSQLSSAEQIRSPQLGGHGPQSMLQFSQLSSASQIALPQSGGGVVSVAVDVAVVVALSLSTAVSLVQL